MLEGSAPNAMGGASSGVRASWLRRNWQKLLAVMIWLGLLGGVVAYSSLTGKSPTATLQDIVSLLQTPYGPLFYILIYTLRPLAFFSAVVLTLLAGAIFGPWLGVIYTVVGSNLSATLAYALGRFLGNGVLDANQSQGLVQRYAERMRRNSFETILIMRFIFLPYDLVNYLGGFLRIDYKAFILATILGSIPGTITFVLAGAAVRIEDVFRSDFRPEFNPWSLAASVLLFGVSLALSRYFKQREARRMAQG